MATSTLDAAAQTRERISHLIRQQGRRPDSLIEVLHRVQEMHGYLPKPALRKVAQGSHMPVSRAYGVASFHYLVLLSLNPPARHRCAVCLGTACFFARGGADPARGTWILQHVSCLMNGPQLRCCDSSGCRSAGSVVLRQALMEARAGIRLRQFGQQALELLGAARSTPPGPCPVGCHTP